MTTDGASMYSSSLLTTATSAPQPHSTAETTTPVASAPSITTTTPSVPVSTVTPTSASVTTPSVSAAAAAASAAAAAAAAQVQVSPSATDTKPVAAVQAAPHAPAQQMAPMAAAAAFGSYTPGMVFAAPDAAAVMEDQPTYVNPKQYARILKRRESRKKQTGTDVTSYTPRKRSYMHESRHKHAMQRRRGPGGRFLSKEEREALNGKETAAAGQ